MAMEGAGTRELLVNFLVVGAQKSGTTALASFLGQHPEICHSPRKELHFFDSANYDDAEPIERIRERYHAWFSNFTGQKIVGESTPRYMFLPVVAERIYRYNPEAKLIVLLRNPIDRTISHYHMAKRRKRETRPLWLALTLEVLQPWLHHTPWGGKLRERNLLARGEYTKQIQNLLRFFPRDQVLILRSEDLLDRHEETLRKILSFVGVEDLGRIPRAERVGDGGYPEIKSGWTRWVLRQWFRKEIKRLERFMQWDLREWKSS